MHQSADNKGRRGGSSYSGLASRRPSAAFLHPHAHATETATANGAMKLAGQRQRSAATCLATVVLVGPRRTAGEANANGWRRRADGAGCSDR